MMLIVLYLMNIIYYIIIIFLKIFLYKMKIEKDYQICNYDFDVRLYNDLQLQIYIIYYKYIMVMNIFFGFGVLYCMFLYWVYICECIIML